MPVNIIENFQLGTNLPLDARYVVDTFFDVSLYWFPGMQVFQTSDSQLYWYDGSIWIPIIDTSLSGNFATISYVDGSLAIRDSSISSLFIENDIQDSSISNLRIRLNTTDSSLSTLTDLVNVHDLSIGVIEDDLIRIDGSLNFIFSDLDQLDASIQRLDNEQSIQDSSIQFLTNEVSQLDSSIQRIDASLGDYVRKDGDTMTGDLLIETDLSVNGKGTFGEFNVSGTTFPGTPSGGDLFYRTDLAQHFAYDASRGKWLSIDRQSFISGRDSLPGTTSGYFGIADLQFTSTEGFLMPRNGTIISASFINANTITRNVRIIINNNLSGGITLGLSSQNSIIQTNINLDVSAGDVIQTGALANGFANGITRGICIFEVAWRE